MLLSPGQVRIARMLVVWSKRLDEADGGEFVVVQIGKEMLFILQMLRLCRCAVSLGGVIGEPLMVVLK